MRSAEMEQEASSIRNSCDLCNDPENPKFNCSRAVLQDVTSKELVISVIMIHGTEHQIVEMKVCADSDTHGQSGRRVVEARKSCAKPVLRVLRKDQIGRAHV